jgi:hypothetical protein
LLIFLRGPFTRSRVGMVAYWKLQHRLPRQTAADYEANFLGSSQVDPEGPQGPTVVVSFRVRTLTVLHYQTTNSVWHIHSHA